MGTFNQKVVLSATERQIPVIAESIRQEFIKDEFDVELMNNVNGGCDISISKGGFFKAILGMKTALNVSLTPQSDGVLFDAHVGIFGQQIIPAAIAMFLFWPVVLTQAWGLIQQSEMDDRALAAAERGVLKSSLATASCVSGRYCTNCGAILPLGAKTCNKCYRII